MYKKEKNKEMEKMEKARARPDEATCFALLEAYVDLSDIAGAEMVMDRSTRASPGSNRAPP